MENEDFMILEYQKYCTCGCCVLEELFDKMVGAPLELFGDLAWENL